MALSGQTIKKYSPSEAFWVWVEWTAVQDVANNRTTITAITYGGSNSYGYYSGSNKWGYTTIDGITTSVKYTDPWAAGTAKKELHRQTRTVNHNDEGLKTVTISGKWTAGSDPEGSFFSLLSSGSFELDPIPRASQPTTNYTGQSLGYPVQISTNRASTVFTHKLKYVFGALSGTIAEGVGDIFNWTLPPDLAAAIPAATSGVLRILCETYSGAKLVGTKEVSITVSVPDNSTFKPTASTPAAAEASPEMAGFTVYAQGKSRLRIQSSATGKYGATISQYKINVAGSNYYGPDITTGVVAKAGPLDITLTVTDSRGLTDIATLQVSIEEYSPPRIINFSAERGPTDQGEDLVVNLSYAISPLGGQNGKSYILRYRLADYPDWAVAAQGSAAHVLATSHTIPGVLDPENRYVVELIVSDSFTSTPKEEPINTVFELVNYNASGKGMAIGKVSEEDGLEVAIPTTFYGPVDFLLGLDSDTVGGFTVLGAGGILDGGSGTNGRYLKLADGTMICQGYAEYQIPAMTQVGAVWGHTSTALPAIAFPATFVGAPSITMTTDIGEALNCALRTVTGNEFTWRLYTTVQMTAGVTRKLYYCAIGRWKL